MWGECREGEFGGWRGGCWEWGEKVDGGWRGGLSFIMSPKYSNIYINLKLLEVIVTINEWMIVSYLVIFQTHDDG